MNTVEQAKSEVVEYDDAEISEYLRNNPDFFERNSELLADLQLPHGAGGGAISLIERQVSVLRNRNDEIETRLREFVHVAHNNDELADKIHALALILMAASAADEVIEIVESQLRTSFGADRAVLTLFNAESASNDSNFLRHCDRDSDEMGPFKTFLESGTARCGAARDAQRKFLFGDDDAAIGSVALVPLGREAEHGFLAIGSRDPDHFHPGKSIEFLTRIGDLVAAALTR